MRPERPGGYCLGPSGCIPERRGLVAGKPHTPGSGARETGPKGRGEQRRIPNWPWHPARVWAPRCLLPRAPSPRGAAPCRPRWGVPRRASQALVRGGRSPLSARLSSTPGARQAPGPLLSGQRDPPIGALGPALGRWILAPHTHRASLPRFAARADWLQYRTPKPNQRLQPHSFCYLLQAMRYFLTQQTLFRLTLRRGVPAVYRIPISLKPTQSISQSNNNS